MEPFNIIRTEVTEDGIDALLVLLLLHPELLVLLLVIGVDHVDDFGKLVTAHHGGRRRDVGVGGVNLISLLVG